MELRAARFQAQNPEALWYEWRFSSNQAEFREILLRFVYSLVYAKYESLADYVCGYLSKAPIGKLIRALVSKDVREWISVAVVRGVTEKILKEHKKLTKGNEKEPYVAEVISREWNANEKQVEDWENGP